MRKIKVCTINPDYYRSSGVTVAISRLQLASNELPIEWINLSCRRDDIGAVKFLNICAAFDLMSKSPVILFFAMRELYYFFKKRKFDIIHVHHRRLAFLCGIVARLVGVPVIYTGHRVYGAGAFLKFAPIDGVIAINKSVLIDSRKYTRAKNYRVISNIASFLPSLQLQQQRRRVVILGRLESEKNHEFLFNAWAAANAGASAQLLVVGEGSLKEHLIFLCKKLGISESVNFFDYTFDVNKYIDDCDFMVLPSFVEGQPIVILEAAGRGKPTLVTDIPGATDCIPLNAVLPNKIPLGDINYFAMTLNVWLNNFDLVRADGLFFYDYLRASSLPSIVACKTYDFYLDITHALSGSRSNL